MDENSIFDILKILDLEKTELHEAAENNDISKLESLLSNEAELDLRVKDDKNKTPLLYAAESNKGESHYKICEILLRSGADVNSRDEKGRTALYHLVKNGNAKIVQLLLSFKAYYEVVDYDGRHLLYTVVYYNKVKALQLIINHGLDINQRYDSIVSFKAYYEVVDYDGRHLLYTVVYYNKVKALQLIINHGLDINQRYDSLIGKTLLQEVANVTEDDSHLEMAKMLLHNGADVNARDNFKEISFYNLVRKNNVKSIELFLKFNADIYAVSIIGQTLLFYAAGPYNYKNVQVVQLLIDLGFNIEHRTNKGETPLFMACGFNKHNNNIENIKCLLKNGANLNAVDNEGFTPLMTPVKAFDYIFSFNYKGVYYVKKNLFFTTKHTDFSKKHSNVLIIEFYSEDFWKIILDHLAKLAALHISIHPDLFETIFKVQKYNDYYKKCQQELFLAKETKLKDSWVSYYDLLVGTRKKLKNYSGNEVLIKDFKSTNSEKNFPIYGAAMVKNVERGIKRRELYDKSTTVLSNCLPTLNPTHLIIRDVLDCISS